MSETIAAETGQAIRRGSTPGGAPLTRARYKVLGFAVALAAITYLDRVCISITAPLMMRDLNLSEVQMSFVFSAFTLAYAAFEIPTGAWGDRAGTRRVLTRIVVWWSAFTIATAAVFNYGSLLVTRFLFGAGEAGAWPNVTRTLSRWFPASERGTAQGIFFAGAHLGGGLTPLLVTALLGVMSWRAVFVFFGAVGFAWAAAWFRWFRDEPAEHRSVSAAELALIHAGRGRAGERSHAGLPLRQLFSSRSLVALCLMNFTQGYGFYFYITWLPSYLAKARGFTSVSLGVLAGLPLILSVAADLLGGLTTDRISQKYGLRTGRCGVGAASLVAAGLFLLGGATADGGVLAALLIACAAATSNFLLGASWGTCIDIAGDHAGVVSACMNTAGQIGGALSPVVLAYIVQTSANWAMPLYITGALYLFGAVCWWFVDPRRPVHAAPYEA